MRPTLLPVFLCNDSILSSNGVLSEQLFRLAQILFTRGNHHEGVIGNV
jgi:hypothetical protein